MFRFGIELTITSLLSRCILLRIILTLILCLETRATPLVAENFGRRTNRSMLWLSTLSLGVSKLCPTVPCCIVLSGILVLLLWTLKTTLLFLCVRLRATCFRVGPFVVSCILADLKLRLMVPCSTRLSGVVTCLSIP